MEEVATAADIEAFMRDRRKARQEKQREEKPNPEVEEYMSEENQLDPYLDPDPDIPWPRGTHLPLAWLPPQAGVLQGRLPLRAPELLQGNLHQLDGRHPPAHRQTLRLRRGAL